MKKLVSLLLTLLMTFSVFSAFAEAIPVEPEDALSLADATLEDVMGVIDGDVYTNPYLGIGFTLPAGQNWTYYSEEEILQANKLAQALATGELKDVLSESQNIILMYAAGPMGSPNVSIQILDLGVSGTLVNLIGLSTILEPQLDTMKKTLENSGMNNVEVILDTMLIDGREEVCIRISYSYFGIKAYTVQVCYIQGDYAVYVASGASEDGVADQLLGNVFWLD